MFKTGYFPLVPYSNRIGHGQFEFYGAETVLQPNRKEEIYPLHGIGWLRAWSVDNVTENSMSLCLNHVAEDGVWPWSMNARQTIEILGDTLKFTLNAKNLSNTPMPIGLGFHPYFANYEHIVFQTDATHIQPMVRINYLLTGG